MIDTLFGEFDDRPKAGRCGLAGILLRPLSSDSAR
jgi:hypothetical protein